MIIQEQSSQISDNTWKSWGLLAKALCLLCLRRTGLWLGFPGWLGEVGAAGLPPWSPPSVSASPSSPTSLSPVTLITNFHVQNTFTVFLVWFLSILTRQQILSPPVILKIFILINKWCEGCLLPASTWDMSALGCSFKFGVVLAGGSYPISKLMVAWKTMFSKLASSALLYMSNTKWHVTGFNKFSNFLQHYTDSRPPFARAEGASAHPPHCKITGIIPKHM